MGLLDRLIRGVNRAAEPVQDVLTPTDPTMARGGELERSGAAGTGVIVGIARSAKNEFIHTVYAVEVASPSGPQRFATEVTTTPHLHRLRLGLAVPVRTDGDRAVIDWPSLAARWNLGDGAPGQRTRRKVPADGVTDEALTSAAARALERGRRTTATIVALDRVMMLGLPTLNWDVHLRLDDGATVTSRKDQVPPYAWWLASSGALVPIGVDPRDPTRGAVDWAALTNAAAGPVGLDDQPPPGSIAEQVMSSPPPTEVVGTMGATDTREIIAANRDAAQVTGTLLDWVGEVSAGRMKPKAFLKNVAEWESAGLCTADEAAAARAAAGLS